MIDIDKLEAKFGFDKDNIRLKSLCNTISARIKNADYCCEYFSRYKHKLNLQRPLYLAREQNLIDPGFDYNPFNRYIFRCVFCLLVSNNISRINNLETIVLELFPDDLSKYIKDSKSFSFKKLCDDFPNANITFVLRTIFDEHHSLSKVQNLRNQMEHFTIGNILSNDGMLDDDDDYFIDGEHTLSGKREKVADFAKSLNELLLKIEEQIFNCLVTHGKGCLTAVELQKGRDCAGDVDGV